jgi:hypothetical protein
MKRLSALLAALVLVLTLSACGADSQDTSNLPDNDTAEVPQETPDSPDSQDSQDTPDPDDDSSNSDATERIPAAEVHENVDEGEVSELVTWNLSVPQIETGNAEVDTILNDYYDNLLHKYRDLAGGEVLEQAAQAGATGNVESSYSVTYNGGSTLSILRSVTTTVADRSEMTLYAETFDTTTGGLYTAEVLFTSEDYAARLQSCVIDQISAGSTELFYEDWRTEVASGFSSDAFFLTEDGYGIFYPADTLCDATIQLVIPYADIADIFAAPEADMV